MDEGNAAFIAMVLGRDLPFVNDGDPRVWAFDANFTARAAGRNRAVRRRPTPVR